MEFASWGHFEKPRKNVFGVDVKFKMRKDDKGV